MIDLIYEYRRSLRELNKMKKELSETSSVRDKEDISLINNMITDVSYVIEWLENGRQPDAKRGYDRREVYKRMVYYDPCILEMIGPSTADEVETHNDVSDVDRERIEDALSVLTKREKDIFLMHHAQNHSLSHIADLLGIKKTTVQTHLERSERKINERKESSLFCVV